MNNDEQRELQETEEEEEREDIYGLRTSYATVSYWDTPTTTTTSDSAGSLAIIPSSSSSSSPRTTTMKNKHHPNQKSLKSSQLDLFCYQSIDRSRSTNTSLSTTATTWNNYSNDTLCFLDNNAVVAGMIRNNTKPKTVNSRIIIAVKKKKQQLFDIC